MLRPERMSKVSVTGSKAYLDPVVEAVHELNLLHVTDYGGGWEGFVQGNPQSEAEDAAEKLVTVRSLKSMLDVDEDDAGPTRVFDDDELAAELEDLREEVNALDDRRDELRSQLRTIEERVEAVEPFAELGIDLDLLQGYDSLQVAVGEGARETVERAIVDAAALTEYQIFGDDVLAVFAHPEGDADESALADALVSAEFAALDVPEVDDDNVSPEAYVDELERERQSIESDLETVESELDAVRADAADFLLAAEEKLAIEVQKTEAPLSYATTANAFVAEGWIPTDSYTQFKSAVQDAVGSHVEIEEVERAAFGADGEVQVREDVPPAVEDAGPDEGVEATDEDEAEQRRAVADGSGGSVVMRNDDPPVVQDNPGLVSPFEVLVQAVGRPNYREFDPSVVLFLTFPAFFGFMIGDLGYGILYGLIGYYLYSNFDSQAFKSMGGVTMAAGLFTAGFGVLYGEIFGLHLISTYLWEGALGLHGPPIHKGLQPADIYWAQAWLVVSTVVALIHLDIGYVFGFLEELEFHGAKAAITEKGSWLLGMNGLWLFVFSRLYAGKKPSFIFSVFDGTGVAPEAQGEFASTAFALGFNGFPPVVGYLGLGMFVLGALLLAVGAPAEILEIFDVLVNVLSYTRIAAVLLAKAGMAFVVNLLFFGAYQHDGEFHFMLSHGPEHYAAEYGREAIMFGGLVHGGIAALVGGIVILVLGHLLVLALGVTSAGLQAVRLEYYEFFSKFFEGGGTEYTPFGHERRFTSDE
ncbi:V-type ATP synthase subunit I [Halobaculum gomorrense]|uniref:A-type ATP synthase subunit I n=1 Tax=Halobaculum gomorrense TaxID=43928 RepID=A0A1M5KDQ5_9EURY|nr:V-type ATP synthase subunit I [Halobaculum gomorrense]SHG50841.1 V/A-type H+-transporting ATPase subunit I [Halobaculum gomorrense]